MLSGVWTAIVVALVWSYGAIAWRKVTRRRTSGLLILTAVLLTGRTVISLVADSTFLYFLQPIISDGIVATAFLLSLASARPLVARLAGDFYPMDHELHLRPRIQRLFWWLTAMWAAICVGRALTSLWLLNSQSLETFVLVKSIFMLTCNVRRCRRDDRRLGAGRPQGGPDGPAPHYYTSVDSTASIVRCVPLCSASRQSLP